ncbi:alpha/beta fold hydrolase [Diaphorobacter sp. HDW4A]|uniref:alpha/beta fold hydrolase n=1 Tax=Diaphorobacter sp. HDW4A TaxID=2714924 RepID=UPI00140AACC6|nr:alpha/beta hydrolase [Diaphorobacter sp. HDW4A]QIL79618.1 alpha/beta fold hydrolase [Diaphorobacter sp. HDW4A]
MATLTEQNTSKRIKTKSWEIHYNEAGSGQPLVLVHGGGPGASGWSNFHPNIPYLAERFRVFAVDLPGWGKSQSVQYDQRDNSGALAEFIEALGLGKVAIVGNSMGGSSCIRLAYERPDLVSHLITLGSSAGVPSIFDATGLSEGVKALEGAYFEPGPVSMRKFIAAMAFDTRHVTDEFVQERVDILMSRPDHIEGWKSGHGKPMVRIDQARLAEIKAPTLLIHGRDDRTVPFTSGLHLVRQIPDARLLLVTRCGHWVQLEHTAEFNRNVASFIKGE